MTTRLEKLELENGGLQSMLSKLEQENGELRSRLAKLEPPSDHYDVQFYARPKDIHFEVLVYMDKLPALDRHTAMRRRPRHTQTLPDEARGCDGIDTATCYARHGPQLDSSR